MFNSTFFKFLITFIVIIGIGFLIMGITGYYESKENPDNAANTTVVK